MSNDFPLGKEVHDKLPWIRCPQCGWKIYMWEKGKAVCLNADCKWHQP